MTNNNVFYSNTTEYLAFRLGSEFFAIQATSSIEVLDDFQIIPVPNTVKMLKGVVNFRGEILSVADLHILFNKTTDKLSNKFIIVCELNINNKQNLVGLFVDQVLGVHEIDFVGLEKAPDSPNQYRSEVIKGMFRIENNYVMLLDEAKIVRNEMLKP